MLATQKQLSYLQSLADRVERVKMRKPSLVPKNVEYRNFRNEYFRYGITTRQASELIDFYLQVIKDMKTN